MTNREDERLRTLLHAHAPEDVPDPRLATRARAAAGRIRRRRRVGYGIGAVIVAALAAATPLGVRAVSGPDDAPQPAGTRTERPGGCPMTSPAAQDEVPPTLRALDGNWVGSADLWISNPTDAVSPGSSRLKLAIFTLNASGRMTNTKGHPTLVANRIDAGGSATGDPMEGDNYASAAGPHNREIHFWPTTITLPSSGCWALTATLHSTTVRFVVQVGKTDGTP